MKEWMNSLLFTTSTVLLNRTLGKHRSKVTENKIMTTRCLKVYWCSFGHPSLLQFCWRGKMAFPSSCSKSLHLGQSSVLNSDNLLQADVNLSRKLCNTKRPEKEGEKDSEGVGWGGRVWGMDGWTGGRQEGKGKKILKKERRQAKKIIFTSMLHNFHSSCPWRKFKQIGNNFKANAITSYSVKIRCYS